MGTKSGWLLLLTFFVLSSCGAQETPVPTATARPTHQPTASPTRQHTMSPTRQPAASPTWTSIPTGWPTFTPLPLVERTPVPGCPAWGDPPRPPRTSDVAEFAGMLEEYLNAGARLESLDQLLREWAWLGTESSLEERQFEEHMAWQVDLTGDGVPETVAMVEYASSTCPAFGDLLIWRCRDGQMELLFSAYATLDIAEGGGSPYYQVLRIGDLNRNGEVDVTFKSSRAGMHANMVRLFVMEWDGTAFVQRAPGFPEMPGPNFVFDEPRGAVIALPGWYGTVGAGIARHYHQYWMWRTWEGPDLTFVKEIYGLPTARIHYLYDGDETLICGNSVAAVSNYQQALNRTDLPTGLTVYADRGEEILPAFARFKLMVAYAVGGDEAGFEETYQQLQAAVPEESLGYVYVLMAQAFRETYRAGEGVQQACEAATGVAEADHSPAFYLDAGYAEFAGYASTRYQEAEDLCRVP